MNNEFKEVVDALKLALKNFIAVNNQLYPNETKLEKDHALYIDINGIVNEVLAEYIDE